MHGVTIRDGTRREMLDSIQSHITRVPSEPVWFLDMIGVAASARGAGVGGALIRIGLERARADGVPAWLETGTPSTSRCTSTSDSG
jgi:ribosomal protein S18 acetylase RimI-like enzyme